MKTINVSPGDIREVDGQLFAVRVVKMKSQSLRDHGKEYELEKLVHIPESFRETVARAVQQSRSMSLTFKDVLGPEIAQSLSIV